MSIRPPHLPQPPYRTPKPHVPCIGSISPPRSSAEVGEVIALMDKRHKTAFESWITDEAHRGYMASVKKPLFEEYWKDPRIGPVGVGRALRWMSEGWSIGSIAELVLKLVSRQETLSCNFLQCEYSSGTIVSFTAQCPSNPALLHAHAQRLWMVGAQIVVRNLWPLS